MLEEGTETRAVTPIRPPSVAGKRATRAGNECATSDTLRHRSEVLSGRGTQLSPRLQTWGLEGHTAGSHTLTGTHPHPRTLTHVCTHTRTLGFVGTPASWGRPGQNRIGSEGPAEATQLRRVLRHPVLRRGPRTGVRHQSSWPQQAGCRGVAHGPGTELSPPICRVLPRGPAPQGDPGRGGA